MDGVTLDRVFRAFPAARGETPLTRRRFVGVVDFGSAMARNPPIPTDCRVVCWICLHARDWRGDFVTLYGPEGRPTLPPSMRR
jgi:hypothetical protein